MVVVVVVVDVVTVPRGGGAGKSAASFPMATGDVGGWVGGVAKSAASPELTNTLVSG